MEALQRADRAQQHRQPELAAEEGPAAVDLAHVVQHPRPERPAVQRQAVAAQRGLALGAAAQVVPDVAVQPAAGAVDDLVQGLTGPAQDLACVLASGTGSGDASSVALRTPVRQLTPVPPATDDNTR